MKNIEIVEKKCMTTTTFQLPVKLLIQLKTMCMLTNKSMGEFIRISIRDKISTLKEK